MEVAGDMFDWVSFFGFGFFWLSFRGEGGDDVLS